MAGGYGGSGYRTLDSVLMFLPEAGDWVPLAPLPKALGGAQASVVGGRLRVNGGSDSHSIGNMVIISDLKVLI